MAVGLIFRFTGMGRTEYDAVNAKLGIDQSLEDPAPWAPGLLSHAAGMGDDGAFYVIEVWTSREAQGSFMQSRLGPAMQAAGVTSVPVMTWIDPIFSYHAFAKS